MVEVDFIGGINPETGDFTHGSLYAYREMIRRGNDPMTIKMLQDLEEEVKKRFGTGWVGPYEHMISGLGLFDHFLFLMSFQSNHTW